MSKAKIESSYLGKSVSQAAHGIMFHHFHGNGHPVVQGSINGEQLADMLEFLGGRETILPAAEWLAKAQAGRLQRGELCLTFDDGILGQRDVAVPVLDALGLTAIFSVYSSVFQGVLEPLEIFRAFRTQHFPDIDTFYSRFFEAVSASEYESIFSVGMYAYDPATYLAEFLFYSEGDRKFRYVRDRILGPEAYNEVMVKMIKEITSLEALSCGLWMQDPDLVGLVATGHVIGLHSYSHPTALDEMAPDVQRAEYKANIDHLEGLLGALPRVVSHPCNAYNSGTIAMLGDLGVNIGFRSNMAILGRDGLEFPREDHANILAMMEERR